MAQRHHIGGDLVDLFAGQREVHLLGVIMRVGQPVAERFLRQPWPVGDRGKTGRGRIGREKRRLNRMAPPAGRLDKGRRAGVGRGRGGFAHHRRGVVGARRGGTGGERGQGDEQQGAVGHAGLVGLFPASVIDRDQILLVTLCPWQALLGCLDFGDCPISFGFPDRLLLRFELAECNFCFSFGIIH